MKALALAILLSLAPVLFAQGIDLPPQGYGLEILRRGEERVYRVAYEVTLERDRRVRDDSRLVIPLPPASEYQNVGDIVVEGATILGYGLDRYGNTTMVVTGVDESFRIGMTVTTRALRTTLPGDYSYQSVPQPELAESFGFTGAVDFRPMPETRTAILDIAREEAPETFAGNLFDPAFLEFYPVSDQVFYIVHGAALQRTREEVGVVGRFVNGLVVPVGGDFFLPDFRLEYYIPGRGISGLKKELTPLTAGGEFIALANSFENRHWLFYVLFDTDDDADRFLKGTARVRLAHGGGEPLDLVYDVPLWFPGWSGEGFLVREDTVPVAAFQAAEDRSYRDETANRIIEEVILAEDYRSGQAVAVQQEFQEYDKVTAVLQLKEPGPDRRFTCRWVLPDGRTYFTWEYVPGASWRSFYTNINGNRNRLEKGLWRLEISVNGVLDYRGHFEVR